MVNDLAVRADTARRCAEAKFHFKDTDAGSIPSDWNAAYVEDLATITTGGRNTQDRVEGGDYPFFVRSQKVERINSYSFDKEAVLTAGDGVGTGKIFHYINGKFDAHQRVYVISDFSERISAYYFYLVFASNFYDRIMQMTAKSSVDSVRREMIARMAIALPSRIEQEAITEAVRDADALIDSLEQLIAKKRLVKQGAMQELLAGRRRLPGFDGEWHEAQLAKVAPLQRGFDLPNSRLEDGPFPVAYSNGVLNSHREYMVKGPGVVTGRSGTLGRVFFIDNDFWPHNTTLWVTQFNGNDPKFIFYLYEFIGFARFASGSGVPTLNRNDAHAYRVKLPPTRNEQAAISTVLSDLDAELEALDTRLEKARQLKKGMMQELLTGRVRLV
ncbi:restriction endonuclease subunit S [Kaustia mangrovi]|uniref:Restriction endonuclease subunit S n=1 Tax=Kaustia mangrovi TaxID=2593653 RepID=A0A7S8C3I8_9HYPH|nr:restriction endonuclease subunit S [Kaustia mangrovi]QPC42728.1 restriction endonuclease subunit S [Kaustia mangrovi]